MDNTNAPAPVELVHVTQTELAWAIGDWLDPEKFRQHMSRLDTETLQLLYDQLHEVRERAWQCQCLIAAELLRRAALETGRQVYGAGVAREVAASMGTSETTIRYRAKIGTVLLSDPECVAASVVLPGETWYRMATEADDPKAALLFAADQKARDPGYSTRQFADKLRGDAPASIDHITLWCQEPNETDHKAAERLARQYNTLVELRATVHSATLPDGTLVAAYGRTALEEEVA